jgi:serine/threonine protein phosphatase PrpC
VHDGRVEQLTEDHSLISDVIRSKGLAGAEARAARATLPRQFRDTLVRVLGMKNDVVVDVAAHAFMPGDRLVLVTGSVGNFVGDAPLEALLARSGDAATLADAVMAAASGAHPHRDHAIVVVAAQ